MERAKSALDIAFVSQQVYFSFSRKNTKKSRDDRQIPPSAAAIKNRGITKSLGKVNNLIIQSISVTTDAIGYNNTKEYQIRIRGK